MARFPERQLRGSHHRSAADDVQRFRREPPRHTVHAKVGHGDLVPQVRPGGVRGRHLRQTRHTALPRAVLPLQAPVQVPGRSGHDHGQVQRRRVRAARHFARHQDCRVLHAEAQSEGQGVTVIFHTYSVVTAHEFLPPNYVYDESLLIAYNMEPPPAVKIGRVKFREKKIPGKEEVLGKKFRGKIYFRKFYSGKYFRNFSIRNTLSRKILLGN